MEWTSKRKAKVTTKANTNSKHGRRTMTRVACTRCRSRKLRCDGTRPTCEACNASGHECAYETMNSTETRTAASQRQHRALMDQNNDLMEENRHLRSMLSAPQRAVLSSHGTSSISSPVEGSSVTEYQDQSGDSPAHSAMVVQRSAEMLPAGALRTDPGLIRSKPSLLALSIQSAQEEQDDKKGNVTIHSAAEIRSPVANSVPRNVSMRSPTKSTIELQPAVKHVASSNLQDRKQDELGYTAGSMIHRSLIKDQPSGSADTDGIFVRNTHEVDVQKDSRQSRSLKQPIVDGQVESSENSSSFRESGCPFKNTFEPSSIGFASPQLIGNFDRGCWQAKNSSEDPCGRRNPDVGHVITAASSVRYMFGNLHMTSEVSTNHYPLDVQRRQRHNMFLPIWAMQTMATAEDSDPFDKVFVCLQEHLKYGVDPNILFGSHPFYGALNDRETFERAPLLSKIIVRMIKSIKIEEQSTSHTQHALMWLHWVLWMWMLVPTPETYQALPNILRPTPWQIFAGHSRTFDFIISPQLRDFICEGYDIDLRSLVEICVTAALKWPTTMDQSSVFFRNSDTGELDLSPSSKSYAEDIDNWTLGPSVQTYLPNADQYCRVQ